MMAVILAAGKGRRLLPYTDKTPKCLLRLKGKAIIDYQIENLRKCGFSKIAVVCGFQAVKVRRHFQGRKDIALILNPFYENTNSVVSVWLSKSEWKGNLLIMNSDVIVEFALFRRFLNVRADIAVLINPKEVNGYRVRLKDGFVIDMRMDIPLKFTSGTYGGITKFSRPSLPLFSRMLDVWLAQNRLNDWYEGAVVGMVKKGAKVFPVSVESYLWHEIDTPSDYQLARRDFRISENEDTCT
jgi:choline kinase